MTTVDIGCFRLIDPPQGMEKTVSDTLDSINYPWERLAPALSKDLDGACFIHWSDSNGPGGGTGNFWGTYDIYLSMQFTDWASSVPFVLAHEIGHMVDWATFDKRTCAELTTLFHQGPGMTGMLVHSNSGEFYRHPNEAWSDSVNNDYVARLNECYADEFVATFAPGIWGGTVLGQSQHWPRFVHWSDKLDEVKRITLAAGTTTQVPEDSKLIVQKWIYAEGADLLAAMSVARATNAAVAISRNDAKALIAAGATITVIGGPACTGLGLTWATTGKTTKGKITACNGSNYGDSLALALGVQ